jgi:succinate dehydrogenase/fumarate reductase flavoprotein subunit
MKVLELKRSRERVAETDVLVVGSGGAGCCAAIEATKHDVSVTLVTKGLLGRSGATLTGDADFDVDSKSLHDLFGFQGTDPNDNKDKFFEDMVKGGKYLNDQRLVEVHVKEAPERFKDFVDWGIKPRYVLRSSGHSYPRGVVIPGTDYQRILDRETKAAGVEIIEETMITDILTDKGAVAGAIALNIRTGDITVYKAKSVVLATGGLMRIYPITTAPEELTGDGYAMAYRAGAELINMEFPMFLPGCFVWPPALRGIDFPFLVSTERELRGWLLNKYGERFMQRWDPVNMECTTRDIASVAMTIEILEDRGSPHGGVYVSLKHLPDNLIEYAGEWAIWYKGFKYGNFDLKKLLPDLKRYAMEAVPASHFTNGGIKINEKCETNIKGLYAAGEVTGGVHGANRLSGNAFTEFAVFGVRAGRYAAEHAKKASLVTVNEKQVESLKKEILKPLEKKEKLKPIELRERIQKLSLEKLGPVRNNEGLTSAMKDIDDLKQKTEQMGTACKDRRYNKEWVEAIQVKNMTLMLEIINRAALMRTESRGAHYRRDFPNTDNVNWLKNIIIKQVAGKMHFTSNPIIITKLTPPKEIFPYGPAK